MTFVVVQNTREGQDAPATPSRPEGGTWGYEMIFDLGESRAYGDSFYDLMCVLIPDYNDLDDIDKATARIGYAQAARLAAQSEIVTAHTSPLTDAEQAATSPSFSPFTGEWNSSVLLVLNTVDYAPWTDVPKPVAGGQIADGFPNIAWVDPSTEESLVESLHTLGTITVNVSTV